MKPAFTHTWALLAFCSALAACSDDGGARLQGYGEADYTYLASQEAGLIEEILVQEGDAVEQGAIVFRLSRTRLSLTESGAAASEAAERARAGGALMQAVQAAEAQAELARQNYARSAELFARGFLSRARLDADRSVRDASTAQLAQAREEARAARRDVGAASAATRLAQTRVSDLDGVAPEAGQIEEIYHRPGEVVGAGEPIAALLAPARMKVRFFAPEALLSRLRIGGEVRLSCDGCATGLTARISFIAREPQFTPPVIYSLEERDKLVFLVEARPNRPDAIRPGMPVDVEAP
jgi:HlyD family secretion protein